jgi:hypothetical protein
LKSSFSSESSPKNSSQDLESLIQRDALGKVIIPKVTSLSNPNEMAIWKLAMDISARENPSSRK